MLDLRRSPLLTKNRSLHIMKIVNFRIFQNIDFHISVTSMQRTSPHPPVQSQTTPEHPLPHPNASVKLLNIDIFNFQNSIIFESENFGSHRTSPGLDRPGNGLGGEKGEKREATLLFSRLTNRAVLESV